MKVEEDIEKVFKLEKGLSEAFKVIASVVNEENHKTPLEKKKRR